MSVAVIVGVLGLWVDGAAHIMGQDPRFADKNRAYLDHGFGWNGTKLVVKIIRFYQIQFG